MEFLANIYFWVGVVVAIIANLLCGEAIKQFFFPGPDKAVLSVIFNPIITWIFLIFFVPALIVTKWSLFLLVIPVLSIIFFIIFMIRG